MTGRPYNEQKDLHVNAPYRAALLTQPGNLKAAIKDAQADPKKTLFGIGHGIPSTFVTKVRLCVYFYIGFLHTDSYSCMYRQGSTMSGSMPNMGCLIVLPFKSELNVLMNF